MRQFKLYEGQVSESLTEVLPDVIKEANEKGEPIFLSWNCTFLRVEPNSTVDEIIDKYSKQIVEDSVIRMYNEGELVTYKAIGDKVSKFVVNFLKKL